MGFSTDTLATFHITQVPHEVMNKRPSKSEVISKTVKAITLTVIKKVGGPGGIFFPPTNENKKGKRERKKCVEDLH